MGNKKQTAVEQFLNAIKDQINLTEEHLEMVESYAKQAKEIEKEQIIDAYIMGGYDMASKEFKPSEYYITIYETKG